MKSRRQLEIRMKPQGAVLQDYFLDRSRVSCIIGALGSGKTFQTCQKIFKLMCEQKPNAEGVRQSRWFAIRNTYGDLLNTTIKDWLQLFGDCGTYKAGGMSPPTHALSFKLDDGTFVQSELIFLALDREDSIKKLRGSQVTGFWLNELKELSKSVIDMADGRHGRFPVNPSWHGILADTNAPDQDHWLYRLAEEEKPIGWKFFKQPGGVLRAGVTPLGKIKWIPNPHAENLINLPDGYYANMLQGKSDDWISVNLANEYGFVSDGRPVYPEYNDALHCHEFEFMSGVPIYRGWDFGVASCVLMQYTPKGRLIIRHEFTTTKTMGIDAFAEHVKNGCAKYQGWDFIDIGDPSGANKSMMREGETCFTVLEEKGIEIFAAPTQDPTLRQEGVRWFLGRLIEGTPAFVLHPECSMLRKGFLGGYCLRRIQVSGERYADKPDKHNPFSHPQDCVQYIASYIRVEREVYEEWDDDSTFAKTRDSTTGY